MEKVIKLQDLLGEEKVTEELIDWGRFSHAKPQHLYEGTDSDDDEIITSRRVDNPRSDVFEPDIRHISSKSNAQSAVFITTTLRQSIVAPSDVILPDNYKEYQLQVGELAVDGEQFCSFQTIKKYPYLYISNANRQKVAEGFFDRGKLYERVWDL
jgi:hypothetical protein